MTESAENTNYVARKPCGCIVAAISLECPPHDVARELAAWIKAGLTVDRVTDDTVRAEFVGWHCPHEPKQTALFDLRTR